jgi:F0F1-type ATP synthase assembly protein I
MLARFAFISQFTGEVLVFLLGGLAIDYHWGWTPWATVTAGFFGLAIALFHLIRNVTPRD